MNHNLRLLILSDVHYPYTDEAVLLDILREEKNADKIIFLGDNVREDRNGPKFLDLIKKTRDLKVPRISLGLYSRRFTESFRFLLLQPLRG